MSFDVFIACFREGETSGFPRQIIRDTFGAHLTELAKDVWQLRYNSHAFCDLYLDAEATDPTLVSGFTVNRPCADLRMWDGLAAILASGNLMLYFPGGRAPLASRSDIVQHAPPDMIEALGSPLFVTSGREILREIQFA